MTQKSENGSDDNMAKCSSVVLGATGLTGSNLIQLLAQDNRMKEVHALVRRNVQLPKKITQHITSFANYDFKHYPQVDIVFCCIGTTLRKAGSRKAFEEVDYDLPLRIAKHYKHLGARTFVLQSSVDAKEHSPNFYLRTKGSLEKAIRELGFETFIILQPSLLLGERKEVRPGESLGKLFMWLFSPFLQGKLNKYKALNAQKVAKAMQEAVYFYQSGEHTLQWEQIMAFNKISV